MSNRTRRKLQAQGKALPKKERKPVILVPNGRAASEVVASSVEATETEEVTPADIGYFRDVVRRHWPLLDPQRQEAQARAMYLRHPFIEKAYKAGLRQGRDIRERIQRGLGIPNYPEMDALQPNERGFVMAKIREAIGVEQ